MLEMCNKHYLRLDENASIIKGFSDAFEQPTDTDICINEQGGRHFELDSEINPPLFNQSRQPLYKYVDGEVAELTEEDRNTLYPLPEPEPSDVDELYMYIIDLDYRMSLKELGVE